MKLSDKVADIDQKIVMVSDKLNLMVDSQNKLTEIHNKYRLVKKKINSPFFSVAKATLHSTTINIYSYICLSIIKTPQPSSFIFHFSSFNLYQQSFISRLLSFSACFIPLICSSIESKLDQILQRLDSPPVSCQSDGAQTYLVGPDR